MVRGLLATPPPPAPTEPPREGIAAIEATFAVTPECPHCQSKRIGTWGSANRLRRYRCKGCGVSFNCLTSTSLAQLHTPDEMRGRVGAVNAMFVSASNQLGDFRAGAMAAAFGTGPAVIAGGIAAVAIAALWMRLFPMLTKLERPEG